MNIRVYAYANKLVEWIFENIYKLKNATNKYLNIFEGKNKYEWIFEYIQISNHLLNNREYEYRIKKQILSLPKQGFNFAPHPLF